MVEQRVERGVARFVGEVFDEHEGPSGAGRWIERRQPQRDKTNGRFHGITSKE
jgi:hypothetical protein